MTWEVEFSDKFGEWWKSLTAAEQKSVDFSVSLLQQAGPTLRMPHSSGVETSRHTHMRELRIQHEGRPYRVLYSIRAGQRCCCSAATRPETIVGMRSTSPLADAIYDKHLRELEGD
jgi:hypothetical protein